MDLKYEYHPSETLPQPLPYQGGELGIFSEPLLDKGFISMGMEITQGVDFRIIKK
jgi:hypothetical protein